ncbi:MAG: Na+/H+ antiporter subunit E [Pseudomonadota bacterium]
MGRIIFLAATLTALWFMLSGYFDIPLLLVFGAASIAACVYLSMRAGLLDNEGAPVQLGFGIVGYWAWLLFEIGKANVVVAREALAVTPRLSPTLVKVPAKQKTSMGRVIFAQSITLTPGTVSMDLSEGEILVHALTEELAEPSGFEGMGDRVAKLDGAGS